jgi:hypothetical protein
MGLFLDPGFGIACGLTSAGGLLLSLGLQSVPPRLSFGRFLGLLSVAISVLAVGAFVTNVKLFAALTLYVGSFCVNGYLYDLARLLGHRLLARLARLATFFQLATPGLAIVGVGLWLLGEVGGMGGSGEGGDASRLGVSCLQAAAGAWGLGALCMIGLLAWLIQALLTARTSSEEEGRPRMTGQADAEVE